MRAVRVVLAIAVVCAALFALRVPWRTQRCNVEKRSALAFLANAQSIASDFQRQATATRAAERMERCIAETPSDWQVHFLAGALYEVAGRTPLATARYQAALTLEERPEIYHAISVLQLVNGQADEGLRNAEKATTFSLEYADGYEPTLRAQLYAKALERRKRLEEQQQR